MTDDTKPTPADEDAVEATTELDASEPVAANEPGAPARPAFDRRTAVFTSIGISALLIAFFGGYALGEHDDEDEARGFRGAPVSMRGGGGAGELRGRGMDGRQGHGGMRGELRRGGRAGGSIGAVTNVADDQVTIRPARGDDEVTVDRAGVTLLGARRGTDGAENTPEVEVGDIVVFRTEE